MYDKANVCRIANQLIKEGYGRSNAFVTAWQIEKGNVARKSIVQTPAQEEQPIEEKGVELLKRVREYKELQMAIEELEAKAKIIKESIIGEMETQQTDEMHIDIFKVRYKTVVSNRFDTTEFKKSNKEVYEQYLKESVSKRFTVAI